MYVLCHNLSILSYEGNLFEGGPDNNQWHYGISMVKILKSLPPSTTRQDRLRYGQQDDNQLGGNLPTMRKSMETI